MNSKIILSGISIVSSLLLVTGTAFALLSSQASATGNTFAATTAGLLIDTGSTASGHPNNSSFLASDTGFNVTGVAPGYNHDFVFWLRNSTTGTVSFNLSTQFINNTGDTALNDVMLVQFTCVNHNNTGTPFVSVQQSVTNWISAPSAIGQLDAGDYARCTMNVQLPSTVGNGISGTTAKFDAQFSADQFIPTPTPTPS